jgi:putative ABC transport system permease protein
MPTIVADLRYSIRVLLKEPAFTFIAIAILALGIGANTAIFSVVNSVLLRPLGYSEPQNIVTILHEGQRPVSPANFLDVQANNRSFTQVAAAELWGGALTGGDKPEEITGLRMGPGMFEVLSVPPVLGRTLQNDDYSAGRDRVVVLSHKLWQRLFSSDPYVIGRQINLNAESFTVVGVMPPDFQFPPFWAMHAEMWAPLDLAPRATNRFGSSLRVFARLKPGVSLDQARADVETINAQLVQSYPETNTGLKLRVDPLSDKVVGNVRRTLLVLVAAVGLVLLIACANVACLQLARLARRQKDAAVRVALGAQRRHILTQLLTESLVLSLCGAIVGSLLAIWGVDWLTTILAGSSNQFSSRMPRLSEISVDRAALAFATAISLATTVLFGLVPALVASKPDVNQTLKDVGRGTTGSRGRLREFLVVAELALALVLLIGAGLLVKSFVNLNRVDPGFNPQNLVAMTVSLAGARQYSGQAREAYYRQLTDKIAAIPGITSVSAINHLPLAGDTWGTPWTIEGRPLPPPGQELRTTFRVSRPAYFRTMGIDMISGRDFTDLDLSAPGGGVVIVNETLARHHWPGEDATGKRITLDDPRAQPRWLTIVGVVKDVKQDSWIGPASNEVYIPFQQSRGFMSSTSRAFTSMTLVARTSVDAETVIPAITREVRSLDGNVPVSNILSMEQVIGDAIWQQRFNTQLIGLFAFAALVLAAVGLYGVMSYSVIQRKQEVGLRIALGAQRRDVVRLIVGSGMKLVLVGVGSGLLTSIALTRLMSNLLFDVSPLDITTFATIALLLVIVALLACLIPALRASRVAPLDTLRA